MKQYLKLIFVLCFIVIINRANAQETQTTEKKPQYTIAMQPFVLANAGLRLEFEKRLATPQNWLQLHVTGYNLSNHNENNYRTTIGSDGWYMSSMRGFNVGTAYKSFFYKETWYLSGGLSYSYHRVKYPQWNYQPYLEDGLTFYENQKQDTKRSFNKIGPSITLGLQSSLRKMFFIDAYLGVQYSASIYKGDRMMNDSPYGYGYSGASITGGFRVGMAFGK